MNEFITKSLTFLTIAVVLFAAAAQAQTQPPPAINEQVLAQRLMREINEGLQKDSLIMILQARVKELEDAAKPKSAEPPK